MSDSARLLPDWIDSYVQYVDNSEPPELFKLWTAVFCIAACLKRKCVFHVGTLTYFPNIYVVLVAPSGKARKGTAMAPGYDLLTKLNVKMAAEATTREALIRELKKAGDEPIVADGRMEFHSSLSIFSQELSVFLGYNNVQLMSDLTDWYDCRSKWDYSTKDKALADNIVNVWVSMYGATTPSMIQTVLPNDAVGLGLTSRIIFVYEENKGKVVPIPYLLPEQVALFPALIQDLEKILLMRGQFSYTTEYMDKYMEWYLYNEAHKVFTDERLSGYVERRATHLTKLCMIFSASRNSEMAITGQDFDRAKNLLERTEVKMPLTFSGMGKNPIASILVRASSLIHAMGEIPVGQLFSAISNDVDPRRFDDVLKALEMSGAATMVISGNKRILRAGKIVSF